ncbi:MAG: ankyrin repeat domain-containing protein [Clostridia bacterium]|nr:ankyrin repeat domain-containing protein [Clostridia bacterium]
MKQLTCEMCGSTEMLKQDGLFVCQTCGTKYTVEEAKKMMVEGTVEVHGNVQVKNAAQLENLLKLAHSSFESKNYAQAEEFCNQVIAMDDQNYDAWKLKGEAINYQINSNNQRILEVYNCIMTSYRVLDDTQKEEKKHEILSSLKDCFEGEVDFWLKQFEANRPTDSALTRAKNAYVDSYNKMAGAFDELGLSDSKEGYLINFDNFFIDKANTICVSAWKSTVGYNYYRDDFSNLGKNWGRGNAWSRLVTTNTDSYRPMKDTALTFLNEGDNLIALLQFAEKQFNESTKYKTKENVYSNIIYFHECISDLVYYKIGSSGNDVGWCEDGSLTDEAKNFRSKTIAKYKNKIEKAKKDDANRKRKEILADSKDKDVKELLTLTYKHLKNREHVEAVARFDAIIEKLPNERFGYLGKAAALADNDDGVAYDTLFAPILAAKDKTVSSEYEQDTKKLLDHPCGKYGTTVLMFACGGQRLNVVQALLDMGADIHKRTNQNTTPLWYVCHRALPEEKLSEGREIARILLDMGADVNITNKGGVALYNKTTDSEIARMIRSKHPGIEKGAAAGSGSGGCYVATAVYGSYDCPQVWTLRRYRDYTLAETWYGRSFIKTYYAISPTLVKWFGHTKWFKKMWQGKLDHMVAKLQANGVESTPYEDKKW